MKNVIKYLLISVAGIGLIALLIGIYLFNKPQPGITKQKTEYIVDALSLMTEYRLDEEKANAKYLGKILEVSGEVMAIESSMDGSVSYSLEDPLFGVTCTINGTEQEAMQGRGIEVKKGTLVTMKGRCDGVLTDVRISDCVVME
jgi:hypothetical protein